MARSSVGAGLGRRAPRGWLDPRARALLLVALTLAMGFLAARAIVKVSGSSGPAAGGSPADGGASSASTSASPAPQGHLEERPEAARLPDGRGSGGTARPPEEEEPWRDQVARLAQRLSANEMQLSAFRASAARAEQRAGEVEKQLAASRDREAATRRQLESLEAQLATLEDRAALLEAQRQEEAASSDRRRILAGRVLESASAAMAGLTRGSTDVGTDLDAAQALVARLGEEAARSNAGPEAEQARAAGQALGAARGYLAQGDLLDARASVQASMVSMSRALSLASRGEVPPPVAFPGGY